MTARSVRGNVPTTRTSGVRAAQDAFICLSPAGSLMNRCTSPDAQPTGSSMAFTCVSLWTRIQRADGPMSRAVWRPSNGVVSESRSPESTSTGRFRGAYGAGVTIGGSG